MKKEKWDTEAKKQVQTDEDEQINQASALWARPKSEITEEQYHEFYKHVAHDFEPPLAYTHAKVEGRQEFTQLFFIPQRAPFDLWDREHRRGIKLYVRRVFIMDDAEQLLPPYLRFVRGIVDSNDLPLNVSREILQQSRDVQTIRAASIKRVLEPDRGAGRETGREVRDVLERVRPRAQGRRGRRCRRTASGLRSCCASRRRQSDTDEQTVSLADYVGRMKEGQDGDLLHHRRQLLCRAQQPAPRNLPQARGRSAADVRPCGRVGRDAAHRVRGEAAAVGRQRRARRRQAGGRGREAGAGEAGGRAQAARGADSDGAEGSRQRRARDHAGSPIHRRAWSATSTA